MMRRTATTLLAVLALLVGGQSAIAGTAKASKPTVTFIAGDGKYLVYSRGVPDHQVLYARSKNGKVRQLGAEKVSNFSLVDATLTGSDDGFGPVSRWNLAAHTSGTSTMPNRQDVWIASTPNGFIYAIENGFNPPYFHESIPSGHTKRIPGLTAIITGPTGYVGLVDKNDHVVFQPYHEGRRVKIAIKDDPDTTNCDEMWLHYLQCVISKGRHDDNAYVRTDMLPLNGAKPFKAVTHGWGPVPLKRKLVWGKKTLTFRSATGQITKTNTHGPVIGEAFEEAIVVPPNREGIDGTGSMIEGVRSAHATPTVLARA